MAKRQRNLIAEAENLSSEPPPPDLAVLMEQHAGVGVSQDPQDMLWKGNLADEEWDRLLDETIKVECLTAILRPIIVSHPTNPDGGPASADVEHRLGQALKHLIGVKPAEGNPSMAPPDQLQKAAEHYLGAAFGIPGAPTSQRQVLLRAYGIECDDNIAGKDKDSLVRPLKRALERRKDSLLVRATAAGLPEVEDQLALAERIARQLVSLGLVTKEKLPD